MAVEKFEKNQQRALIVQMKLMILQVLIITRFILAGGGGGRSKKYTTKSPNLFLYDLTVLLLFCFDLRADESALMCEACLATVEESSPLPLMVSFFLMF
nr:hypothetical protein Iba_chr13bCG8840 [Ipomoea batatas]